MDVMTRDVDELDAAADARGGPAGLVMLAVAPLAGDMTPPPAAVRECTTARVLVVTGVRLAALPIAVAVADCVPPVRTDALGRDGTKTSVLLGVALTAALLLRNAEEGRLEGITLGTLPLRFVFAPADAYCSVGRTLSVPLTREATREVEELAPAACAPVVTLVVVCVDMALPGRVPLTPATRPAGRVGTLPLRFTAADVRESWDMVAPSMPRAPVRCACCACTAALRACALAGGGTMFANVGSTRPGAWARM